MKVWLITNKSTTTSGGGRKHHVLLVQDISYFVAISSILFVRETSCYFFHFVCWGD